MISSLKIYDSSLICIFHISVDLICTPSSFLLQAGGELTDFIIILRTSEAVKTFSGNAHLSVGAGLSAAVGPFGRVAEADFRAGDGGYAACYTYSCSKGVFISKFNILFSFRTVCVFFFFT